MGGSESADPGEAAFAVKPTTLHEGAEEELLGAAEWYENRARGLGHDFIAGVTALMERISEAPGSFPRWEGDGRYRKAKLPRFPYAVFYEERDADVRVLAVAHGRREPGYWLRRG